MARDSLSLQVSVLSEQVGAQKEKIRDLENMLASKKKKIGSEGILNELIENGDDCDSAKLDLKAEVTKLKLKCAQLERDKFETEKKLRTSQVSFNNCYIMTVGMKFSEIEHLSQCMQEFLMQRSVFPQQATSSAVHSPNQCSAALQHNYYNESNQSNTDPAVEMEQLRLAVQKLIVDNEQKNIQINSLRNALDEHCCATGSNRLYDGSTQQISADTMTNSPRFYNEQVAPPFDINEQLRKLLTEDNGDSPSQSTSVRGYYPVSQTYVRNAQPSSSYATSMRGNSPQQNWANCGVRNHSHSKLSMHSTACLPIPSSSSGLFSSPNYRGPSSPAAARQLAAELDELRRINDEVQQNSCYNSNSLLRSQSFAKSSSTFALQPKKQSVASSGGVSGEYTLIGVPSKGSLSVTSQLSYRQQVNRWLQNKFWHSRFNKRTTSTPNLGLRRTKIFVLSRNALIAYMINAWQNVKGNWLKRIVQLLLGSSNVVSDDEVMRGRKGRETKENGKFKRDRTSWLRSSLRNLFGKITRSTSRESSLQDSDRDHVPRPLPSARYPSAGPVSGAIAQRPPANQFAEWNNEQICEWMAEIGFSVYVPQVEEFVKNGTHLLNMTDQEFEKDLGIKNSLHRKRLRCILNTIACEKPDISERMDVHQVLRWLDEIGLPQYRETFAENMIDGQMLSVLTAQDLVDMKIFSALHHASIRRGIQYLHSVDFCLYRLEKRFNPNLIGSRPCPADVEGWSHLCTCQWLKTIDLAEFTPNLLCAGVNGALMVHEPTFTAESLAEVLQIPMHKTLLRRHLTTHFNQLLGQEIISHKREVLSQPFQVQLTPHLKVKFLRKGFSLSRKRGKNEVYVEPDEPLCPPLGFKSRVSH
ncbi:unnamed protein product [Enterobius vermicularis]|uniref:Liprin-beta n=1 Tax=Enterobius vermicularis TaxID=51028 RepID=A0A0N4V9A1_ENTVE|nr:unnamed protein product [Enterobius vermicularis]